MSSIPLGPEQEAQVQASADKIQNARRPPVEKLARPPLVAKGRATAEQPPPIPNRVPHRYNG